MDVYKSFLEQKTERALNLVENKLLVVYYVTVHISLSVLWWHNHELWIFNTYSFDVISFSLWHYSLIRKYNFVQELHYIFMHCRSGF